MAKWNIGDDKIDATPEQIRNWCEVEIKLNRTHGEIKCPELKIKIDCTTITQMTMEETTYNPKNE